MMLQAKTEGCQRSRDVTWSRNQALYHLFPTLYLTSNSTQLHNLVVAHCLHFTDCLPIILVILHPTISFTCTQASFVLFRVCLSYNVAQASEPLHPPIQEV